MLEKYFKSIVEQDTAAVVICDLDCKIIYMNKAAVSRYHGDLTGKSLKNCHSADSNKKIDAVIDWFKTDKEHNIIFTYHNPKENKDVYMVALRDGEKLIGFYEKHEYRTPEAKKPYNKI